MNVQKTMPLQGESEKLEKITYAYSNEKKHNVESNNARITFSGQCDEQSYYSSTVKLVSLAEE